MKDITAMLRRDERVTLALRSLYEAHGYRKFRMSKFEEYDFYALYRDFLPSAQIISFTDLGGKLMALRPDVTLSIVKKAREGRPGSERLYYAEPVYRPAGGMDGYRESFQVGVEHIGEVTPYASVEMISLAAQSLSLISERCVLDVSHTGYMEGILDALPVEKDEKRQIRACIETKNMHELARAVEGRLTAEQTDWLVEAASLSGPAARTLQRARTLSRGAAMLEAVRELEALALALPELSGMLRFDVSISGDVKYYSGLILRGYVDGVPGAVLSGGRYDPLLRRMGKPSLSAMGFAVYFDELARYLSVRDDAAVDTVVLYGQDTPPARVAEAVRRLVASGERVLAATSLPDDIGYSRAVEVDRDA